MSQEFQKPPIQEWAYQKALEELTTMSPKVKANRLAVEKENAERSAKQMEQMSWQEMFAMARFLDGLPELVQELAQEYDLLITSRKYEQLYGEYWPAKRFPPILQIKI